MDDSKLKGNKNFKRSMHCNVQLACGKECKKAKDLVMVSMIITNLVVINELHQKFPLHSGMLTCL
ncbi:hypothetical protein X798_07885 [Onchocerca flexuosa]|uniref:Uncharacterized protein n=1 Tax=Onchocerca flexuosa TaxID=387005 RepID=A0A238BKS0_9BILA|nr:hypothetical protein X798_07885 [Onchocerca flexuosa]